MTIPEIERAEAGIEVKAAAVSNLLPPVHRQAFELTLDGVLGNGSYEDQKQAGYETVNTGGLCDRASKKHRTCYITFAFRLTSDRLKCLCYGVTFTDTRSDTCDQGASCADCASCESDTFC